MRRAMMLLTAVTAITAVVTASLGWFRTFSFVSALVILLVIAMPAMENTDGTFFQPYTGLIVILGSSFAIGLTGIWITWDPTVTEYTYVLGVPVPTLFYFVFIWLVPTFSALYYAFVFDRVASEEIVEDIINTAHTRQREQQFPLAIEQPDQEPIGESQRSVGGDDDD